MKSDECVNVFKVLADPTRVRILRLLTVKSLCVCEVMSIIGMAQSTTSKHLRMLRDVGLIEDQPGSIWTVYRITAPLPAHLDGILKFIKSTEESALTTRDTSRARSADRNRLCTKKNVTRLMRKR